MMRAAAARPSELSLPDLAPFPRRFVWGAATAAYQIEGAVTEDNRIHSIWDTFCHRTRGVADGSNADVAADHYHRVDEDVALMAEVGLDAYRFSIAWPRITDVAGGRNQKGIDFYSRLVDKLLAAGITPVATLYHWDLPQHLEDAGGWTNRDTAFRFADYAAIVASALADRVGVWTTLNEPWCVAFLGYRLGVNAPGRKEAVAPFQAAHHLNLAHGAASAVLREIVPDTAEVSLTLNTHQFRAASTDEADLEALRKADIISNRVFLDPVLDGRYPEALFAYTAGVTDWSFIGADDLKIIHARPDVLGLNYYQPVVVSARRADAIASEPQWAGTDDVWTCTPAPPYTAMNWTIDPTGLTDLLMRFHQAYPDLPLMVTENGAAFPDNVRSTGPGGAETVRDTDRIDYLRGHIAAVGEAIRRGADLRGYFVWSFLDTFEWNGGFLWRLGLVRVDYSTLRRSIKQSGYWYRDLIRTFRMLG